MDIFRRVLRWLFILGGFVAGLIMAIAALLAQRLINPPRQLLWRTPADLDMDFEEISFPAADGIRLNGWFMPARDDSPRRGATLILVHGWGWNRLGKASTGMLANLTAASPVDLLRLAFALHQDGFQLLMFDSRNHGESGGQPPMTFGQAEAQDVLGALTYLSGRLDVAANRLGAIGFSTGANAILFALPQTNQIQAAIAIQPAAANNYSIRVGRYFFGPLGRIIMPLTELIYRQAGGSRFRDGHPGTAVSQAGQVPVLFIQGLGDPWGSAEDVQQLAAATPAPSGPLLVQSTDRYAGYQYLIDNPAIASAFFEQHLPE